MMESLKPIVFESNTNICEVVKNLDLQIETIEQFGIKYGIVYLPLIVHKYPKGETNK